MGHGLLYTYISKNSAPVCLNSYIASPCCWTTLVMVTPHHTCKQTCKFVAACKDHYMTVSP